MTNNHRAITNSRITGRVGVVFSGSTAQKSGSASTAGEAQALSIGQPPVQMNTFAFLDFECDLPASIADMARFAHFGPDGGRAQASLLPNHVHLKPAACAQTADGAILP